MQYSSLCGTQKKFCRMLHSGISVAHDTVVNACFSVLWKPLSYRLITPIFLHTSGCVSTTISLNSS